MIVVVVVAIGGGSRQLRWRWLASAIIGDFGGSGRLSKSIVISCGGGDGDG